MSKLLLYFSFFLCLMLSLLAVSWMTNPLQPFFGFILWLVLSAGCQKVWENAQ